ncbi:MAG: amidohydrolase, partial [Syntrophales bacterium]|nr:amidohydrolase [Syntrophales bacterium]
LFVRKGQTAAARPIAKELIEAEGFMIIPGLVNTHTHLPMVCFRGLADDLPLNLWLREHIFPAESRFVNREFCAAGARLAIAEMILSGTTTVCDSYYFPGSIARVAMEAGIRAVVCAGFADFPVPGIPNQEENVILAEKYLDKWTGLSDLLTPALFCHAPYTCSPETMRSIKDVARRRDALFMTHLAETRWEVEEIRNRYGATPLRHVDHLGLLDENTVLVHCIWVDDEEIEILADRGSGVSHNPESSMKLAAGIAPISKMLERGITVGLGTDGAASNNDLDLIGEMATTSKIHKHVFRNAAVMDGENVLRMATIEGARLIGLEKEIGSLERGKRADIILLDTRTPRMTPPGNPFEKIVNAASAPDVATVIIDGKIVMRDRVITTIDPSEAMERVRSIMSK